MRSRNRLFLFALIIFLLFGAAPAVNVQEAIATVTAVETIVPDFATAEPVICGDPAESYPRSISSADEIDVYSIELVAGQVLAIDVDTVDNGATLDTILDVYADTDPYATDDTEIPIISNDNTPSDDPQNPYEDPYLEIIIDKDGTYYLVIYDALNGGSTGAYTLSLKCSVPSAPDVAVGDLLGATGTDSGSLLDIEPGDATSSVRYALGIGPITDIEFDLTSDLVFVAINGIPGRIIAIDPNSGLEVKSFSYESGAFWALESAGDTLYGVYSADDGTDLYSLVTIDRETGIIDLVESFKPVATPIESLAYNSLNNALYGLSGIDLIQIDLGSFTITPLGPMTFGNVVSLDFDPNNSLYVATRGDNNGEQNKLFEIDHANGGVIREAGPLTDEDGSSVDVIGLTFVIEEAPQDEDPPINTICSSSFSNQTVASSESANNRLARFKRNRNRRNGAIGLFKFEGELGETLNLSVCLEEKEVVESEKTSISSWIEKLWPQWKPKNRVFVVIRDAIPGVEFRAKQKGVLTQDEPALDITGVELPATGLYYIMVIRPFRQFHNFDYCLSLESDGQAWDTLDVGWSNDESEESAPSASAEETKAEPQADEGPVVATGTANASDSVDTFIEPTTPSLQKTTTSDPAVKEGGDDTQAVEGATVAEKDDDFAMSGAPPIDSDPGVEEGGDDVSNDESGSDEDDSADDVINDLVVVGPTEGTLTP